MALFSSGLCALVTIAQLREFRLVSALDLRYAALAVLSGPGAGGLFIGRRADRARRPLTLYAQLEAVIAALAALSPLLLIAARGAYVALGGIAVLGAFGAALVRLALTMLVLLGPTFLMGGTLPAAARAVESESDASRRGVGLLYGSNTLGAVAGCLLANFWLLETLGTRRTLWLASGVNLAVAALAYVTSRFARSEPHEGSEPPGKPGAADEKGTGVASPAATTLDAPMMWLVLGGSGVTGFVFFLMELV